MQVGLLFNRTVNPSAELDEETLEEIASLTGGIYQRARSTAELASIYGALDELEPIELDADTFRPKVVVFLALGTALALTLTWIIALVMTAGIRRLRFRNTLLGRPREVQNAWLLSEFHFCALPAGWTAGATCVSSGFTPTHCTSKRLARRA